MASFATFYTTWNDQLHHLLRQLCSAPKPPTTQDHLHHLSHLVDKVLSHYSEYYRVKAAVVERDVLEVFAAPWASSLEKSLHWIAGWRPTTVFHLVYTESSILFESHIVDILRGMRTGDLGDLSPSQFRRVSELQCETVKEENAITDELSEWQHSIGDLMGTFTEVDQMIGRLASVVQKADDLRLRTLKKVVNLLTPQQAVEFLIAAAELQFGIREWGMNQDGQRTF
ncbi:protein DOG1-like 4 [Durio zibethinus]|uniref:Protein DOG1-like 4 n=1 Tax=Durio zibethinus TaxID=66656 RepID=A0A6P5WR92_DURZI|nr:protein DOG1-like 4 [Durio zibethinus]